MLCCLPLQHTGRAIESKRNSMEAKLTLRLTRQESLNLIEAAMKLQADALGLKLPVQDYTVSDFKPSVDGVYEIELTLKRKQ